MLLFACDAAKLLLLLLLLVLLLVASVGMDVPVPTLVGVICAVATDEFWFEYSPLPIVKTVDCESPPSSLADESSRAYLP